MKERRVVVTGLGVVSSVGFGWQAFWESLLAGRSGIRRISYIDTAEYPSHFGGEVVGFEPAQYMDPQVAKQVGRGTQFAIAASRMALDDARLTPEIARRARVGVCLGTTMADIQALETMNAAWVKGSERNISGRLVDQYPGCMMSTNVAKYFEFIGPNIMVPTACAAGNYAIGYATDLIRAGRADIALAGGADPFSRIAFTGFNRLLAIAPERCQPFDLNRQGTIVGEGAGVLVLESMEAAKARGAAVYAEILGYGLSCDGHHMTIPEVEGVARVMEKALRDADLSPKDVDYISAHGTGTPANDKTECAAIRKVFGAHTDQMPVSSIKSMLGHTMGAASALEAIACSLAIKHKSIPPTINYETVDPECAVDCVPNHARILSKLDFILNNSFAFGGNNACLIIKS